MSRALEERLTPGGEFQVFVRNVYGNPMVYPASPRAEAFAALLGVKTFNRRQLDHIEGLGEQIIEVEDPRYGIHSARSPKGWDYA